jgi:prepilin-type N-terminal cleavage/methylation domain-containing protein
MVKRPAFALRASARPGPAFALRDSPTYQAGFTLVELLVATTICLCVLAATIVLASQVQKSYQIEMDAAAVRNEAEYAVDWISRELRSAGANPYRVTVSGCPAAGTTFRAIGLNPDGDALPDDIRFHADLNPPNNQLGGTAVGQCTEANEDVTIAHDPVNRVITRRDNNVDAAAVQMTDAVITALTFTYLDRNRGVTADEGSIAFIRVTVTAQTRVSDPNTSRPRTMTVADEVRVRVR